MSMASYVSPNGAAYELRHAQPSEDLMRRRLKSGIYSIEDSQLFKRCSRCKDYWPADTEFFYSAKGGDGLNQWCKACYQEWRYPNGRNEDSARHPDKPDGNHTAMAELNQAYEQAQREINQ